MEEDLYGDHNNTEISLFLEQRLHPQSPYALLRAILEKHFAQSK